MSIAHHRRARDPDGVVVPHKRENGENGMTRKLVWAGLGGFVTILLGLVGVLAGYDRANVISRLDNTTAMTQNVSTRQAVLENDVATLKRGIEDLKAGQMESEKLLRELLTRQKSVR